MIENSPVVQSKKSIVKKCNRSRLRFHFFISGYIISRYGFKIAENRRKTARISLRFQIRCKQKAHTVGFYATNGIVSILFD